MPRPKKIAEAVIDLPEIDATESGDSSRKALIMDLLGRRIPGLFDRHPNGSISANALSQLVNDLMQI